MRFATQLDERAYDILQQQAYKRMSLDKLCKALGTNRLALRKSLRADIRFTIAAEMVSITPREK